MEKINYILVQYWYGKSKIAAFYLENQAMKKKHLPRDVSNGGTDVLTFGS